MPQKSIKRWLGCLSVTGVYECCSQVDPKIAIKADNRMSRLLNWKTTDDHPHYEDLMQGMFSDVNNPLVFSNIVLNPRELSILQLMPLFVEPRSVSPVANEADESDDDFMDIQPHISTTKGKEKVGDSLTPVKKKPKQQTIVLPPSTRTQSRHIVKLSLKKISTTQPLRKKSVSPKKAKDEFDDIRRVINEKFRSFMDVVTCESR
ncbi:hypothetical protein HAX54_017692, partial [Datura stramonium]|nr:hypothetical protein [Datura stramonium]